MGVLPWAQLGAAVLRNMLTPIPPPTHQYLVSIPLRMFRLWAFTGMMAQVSTPGPHLSSYLSLGQPAPWSPWPSDRAPFVPRSRWPGL